MATEVETTNDDGEQGSQDDTTQTTTDDTSTTDDNQTAADDASVSSEIDWSNVDVADIPKNILEKHPAYKAVLSETIARRKELATLKQQQTSDTSSDDEGDADPNPLEAKLASLELMMGSFLDMQVTKDTNEVRQQLAAAHNVPESRTKYIVGETMEELTASAKELGDAQGGVQGSTSAGNAGGGSDVRGSLKARIRGGAEDKGTEAPSIFDVGTQRVRGGGALR